MAHLEVILSSAALRQAVVELVNAIELAALHRVGKVLLCLLNQQEMRLHTLTLRLLQNRHCLVWVTLQSLPLVCCRGCEYHVS